MSDPRKKVRAQVSPSESERRRRARQAELACDPAWPRPPAGEATYISGMAWIGRLFWYRQRFNRNPPDWVARMHWREQSSWVQAALYLNRREGLSPDEWRNRPKPTWPAWVEDLRKEVQELLSREIERALKKHSKISKNAQ